VWLNFRNEGGGSISKQEKYLEGINKDQDYIHALPLISRLDIFPYASRLILL
jgi:hypothetical protein